jgi:hypothetical protein
VVLVVYVHIFCGTDDSYTECTSNTMNPNLAASKG